MKFEYIREFVTAAKSVELQQAAAALGISPSSLTKHMTALENEIGASLFKRKRKTELSRFGRLFLPFAKQLADLHDNYSLEISDGLPSPSGSLNIGMSPSQNKDKVRRIFGGFSEAYPDVRLERLFADERQLCDKVRAGKCDIAVVGRISHEEREDGLIFFPFCSYRLSAIFLKSHPLSGATAVDLQQLRYIRTIMDKESSDAGEMLMRQCRALGFEPVIEYTDTYQAFELVRSGEGVLLHTLSPGVLDKNSAFASVPVMPEITSALDLALRREALDSPAWVFMKYVMERENKDR